MLGAAGAWVGSAFLATEEAGIQPFQKQAIVEATKKARSFPARSPASRRA